jgi:hypothetical protein
VQIGTTKSYNKFRKAYKMQAENTQTKLYIGTWVATDGITTIRFLDLDSAKNYCSETGWPPEDMQYIATELTISEQLGLQLATPQEWASQMDQEHENSKGKLIGSLWLPDPACLTAEDQNPPNRRQVEILARRLDWPYRDLAASSDELLRLVQDYVTGCDHNKSQPTREGALQYFNALRDWTSINSTPDQS